MRRLALAFGAVCVCVVAVAGTVFVLAGHREHSLVVLRGKLFLTEIVWNDEPSEGWFERVDPELASSLDGVSTTRTGRNYFYFLKLWFEENKITAFELAGARVDTVSEREDGSHAFLVHYRDEVPDLEVRVDRAGRVSAIFPLNNCTWSPRTNYDGRLDFQDLLQVRSGFRGSHFLRRRDVVAEVQQPEVDPKIGALIRSRLARNNGGVWNQEFAGMIGSVSADHLDEGTPEFDDLVRQATEFLLAHRDLRLVAVTRDGKTFPAVVAEEPLFAVFPRDLVSDTLRYALETGEPPAEALAWVLGDLSDSWSFPSSPSRP